MKKGELFPLGVCPVKNKMVKYTGEKRPPKKGEWYLSGAIIEGYKAPNDLTTPFHVGVLVTIETLTITREVKSGISAEG